MSDAPPARLETAELRAAHEVAGSDRVADPFMAAVRASRMPMVISDPHRPDNPIVYANHAFCTLSGYAPEEVIGRNCRFLQGPGTDPAVLARIRAAVAAGERLEVELRNYRKDGTPFVNRLMMEPVHDESGALAFYFADQVDVTLERERLIGLQNDNAALLAELREKLRQQVEASAALRAAVLAEQQARDALQAKAAEFEALAENVRHLAWIADPDGSITWYNRRWYAYTGTTLEAMRGWGWRAVHHPDHVDRVLADVAARWQAGEAWQDVYLLRSASGEFRPFLTQVEPIRDRAGTLLRWFGTNTDITPQHDAEQQLRLLNQTLAERVEAEMAERSRTEEMLRHSQKMEAVGQLTGGLAHDFNNLLTGIVGSLEMLQNRVRQGRTGELDRYVTAAQGAARRAAALTHRLLAFSRRQTLAPKPTDVNRLVLDMEELVRRTVGPEIAVEVVAAGGLWATLVDPPQLESALLNLCINARDAMPHGGRITIETANRWLDDRNGAERELPPGQYLSLSVTDTGVGMTRDVIRKAFDPFFTTKPTGQGTGLGLSMIYGFARQSGGQVRIYSELEQGTTVTIYLPRHYGAQDSAEAALLPAEHGRQDGSGTVLVVDDEPAVRMLVADVLEDLGYTVLDAADGGSALRVLARPVRIDLLVTDVGLPGGVNGRQVADAARVARPDLQVLFITGYAENAVLNHGHLDPGMHVMTKPFAMDELGRRVQQVMGER
jgi:PAS domain S-box-containing protein